MSKEKEVRISGKVLAALNMPDACQRCFWIKQKVKNLPFQIFPGIFSSIDAYTKRAVHAYFDIYGEAPWWIPEFAEAQKYLKVPHWSKFQRLDTETGITVSGAMDDLFECEGGDHIIPDYKTAKYTANADKLYPLYEGQLNAYRWVHEGAGNVVKSLPLIYCEPVTAAEEYTPRKMFNDDGFNMAFSVHTILVDMDDRIVPGLLRKAKIIIDMKKPPESAEGCKDCGNLDELIDFIIFKGC